MNYLWLIALVGIFVSYAVFGREWWPILTFSLLGVTFLVRALIKLIHYVLIQRHFPILLFSIVSFLFAIAMGLHAVSFLSDPSYLYLRTYSRWVWLIALPLYAVSTAFEYHWLHRQIQQTRNPFPPERGF